MLSWQYISQPLRQITNSVVSLIKSRRREEAILGLAALLFWLGYSFSTWLTPELKGWFGSWNGLLIIPGVLYIAGVMFLFYGGYRIWQLVITPDLPPPKDRPSAIKGPIAFTPADGELFRRLGREDELAKLLGFIEDDQVHMVVLMGASGVGKTSFLRAGLTDTLRNKEIDYHYWEAIPTSPSQRLLRAIQESWSIDSAGDGNYSSVPVSTVKPESLEDLVNLSSVFGKRRHVIVLDQLEQLHGISAGGLVFRLLRKVAREAKPPHHVTWIVAFRREFRAEWEDLTLPEKERGIYPAEISLRHFTAEQASTVISQLIAEAQLSIQQKVIDNLVAAITVNGEVSPVDIGIGLLVLAELHDRQGRQTVTLNDYQFAGGAEGILTQYINRCLDIFPEKDRQTLLNSMLALREPQTNQRIAEGKTCAVLAQEVESDTNRLKVQLDRLAKRDMRLLEIVNSSDGEDTYYRLTHERLIPALHRIAGQLLAEVDQTKLRFENAFTAWKNSGRRAQYLLKAGDLRAVKRYETQIPWGNDAAEKRDFLRRSHRRRTFIMLGVGAIVASLITAGWVASSRYQRYDATTYLSDNSYPPELYDWQHQLKVLQLNGLSSVKRFPWFHSNSLEEITVKVPENTSSLDGLATALSRGHALKSLTLDISESRIDDLTPLAQLHGITKLSLNLSDSEVRDLAPLTKLSALTQLTLTTGPVDDLTPLAQLPTLTYLNLDVSSGAVRDLTPLTKLTKLTELNLNLGFYEGDLTPLTILPALKLLALRLGGSKIYDLMPLAKLPAFTQLSLDFSGSEVNDLRPLTKLPALTQLTLDTGEEGGVIAGGNGHISAIFSRSEVQDLTILTQLSGLAQLTLNISGSNVKDLTPLTKLAKLTHLTLDSRYSKVSDLTPLAKIPALSHLVLNVSDSEVHDLTQLSKLSALTRLSLEISGSAIGDLTPLTKLDKRTQFSLNISNNDVSDLTPLTKLSGLSQLNLDISGSVVGPYATASEGTKVRDLTPLTQLTALTQLSLNVSGSEVNDLSPLSKLPALTQLSLNIGGSKVSDLSPLVKLHYCQTLILEARGDQRVSLKAIPQSLTHLEF